MIFWREFFSFMSEFRFWVANLDALRTLWPFYSRENLNILDTTYCSDFGVALFVLFHFQGEKSIFF